MSIFGDEDQVEFDTRELTYPGNVDADEGAYLGPGMNGRIWRVVGAIYDPIKNETKVTVESPQLPEDEE